MVVAGVVLIVIGVVFLLGGPIYARTHASASAGFNRVRFVVLGLGVIVVGVLIATGVFHH
jgi:hypothetical protein